MEIEVPELLENYLKLLYSPVFSENFFDAKQSEYSELALKSQINRERLKIEQYARFRNFLNHLQMSLTLIPDLFAVEELEVMTALYLDSHEFWEFQGRSLLENFCLFAHQRLTEQCNPVKAELVKLQGVVAGIMQGGEKKSPWGNAVITVGDELLEEFPSPFELVSKNNGFISPKQLEESLLNKKSSLVFYSVKVITKNSRVQVVCKSI